MRYSSPKRILWELAQIGSSATRSEALRLMQLTLPEKFGPYRRYSRESLLRRLVCNRKKSARARLAAFKDLIFGISLQAQHELDCARKET